MTNFQSSDQRPNTRITPERALLVLPISGGLFLAALVVSFFLVPLIYSSQKHLSVVSSMEKKVEELPFARRQLDEATRQYTLKKAQQDRLLSLVAGTTALRTWLTTVNRLADLEQVSVLQVDPQPTVRYVPPPPPDPSTKRSKKSIDQPLNADPLLVPDVERRSAVITFQGPFPNLLSLMRRVEMLESVVIASDIELELVPSPAPSNNAEASVSQKQSSQARLKVKYSAYGRSRNSPLSLSDASL